MSDQESSQVTEHRGVLDNFADDPDIVMPGEEPQEQAAAGDEEGDSRVESTFNSDPNEPDADASEQKTAHPAAKPVTPAAKPKQITFKMGDQNVALDEEAVVEWKVDGKPTPIPVKELLGNYAGKVAWDKRFNEVALEKRKVAEDRQQYDGNIDRQRSMVKDLHEKVSQGKTFEAVQTLIQMTGLQGIDPRDYVKTLRNSLMEQAKQFAGMTDEQRQLYELNEEREYQAAQLAGLRQQSERETQQRAYQSHVAKVIQDAGISQDEYLETYNFLKDPQRQLDASKITPEFVVSHHKQVKIYDTARRAIGAVEPDALDEQGLVKDRTKWQKFAQVATAFPDLTAEELAEIYQDQRKQARSESASRKVLKAPVATAAMASTRGSKREDPEDFTKFTDKDFEWVRRR